MTDYDFILKFALADPNADPSDYVARLESSGCDDALIGIGKKGRVALNFTRTAASSSDAVKSALQDVRKAIPDARFMEAVPDLVGLTDVAQLAGCTRQNMRKITISDSRFPTAVHEGNPELFHLVDVLNWMHQTKRKNVDVILLEVAGTNRDFNLAKQINELPNKRVAWDIQAAFEA